VTDKGKEKDKEKDKDKNKKADKAADGKRVPGLLQSTNPDERAKQVQAKINQGAKDPFANLPPIIAFKPPIDETNRPTAPTPTSTTPTSTAPTSTPTPPRRLPRPTVIKPEGVKMPKEPAIAALPPLPDPILAKAVEVTGVIVVAGIPQAIVKAPEEATTRYVQAGQRLSNGKVLVKRIEMNNGSEPIVILEQNGVEVARAVGDKPAGATTASAASHFRFV
jgi:hypothetical protein